MRIVRVVFHFSFFVFLLHLSGCGVLGWAAHAMPPATVQPKYTGFANQSVGIMIWADRGLRIDWPNLQIDLANAVQKKLVEAQQGKAKVLLGTKFDVQPASIVRYQQDHPEIESQPVAEVAPKLGVTRLIYVEMEDFATRSDMAVELFRGQAKGTVRVIEVENGTGKVVFEQANVTATYPPKAPREGLPTIGDARTYAGTIDAFSTEIAHLFVPWTPEE